MHKKEHWKNDDYYKISQTNEYTYRFSDNMGVYFDLFVGENKALLYDTGYGFGDIKKAVRKITDKPIIVVNSHGHLDHTCGNFQFADCKIYMHRNEQEIYMMHNSQDMRAKAVKYAKMQQKAKARHKHAIPERFDSDSYIKAEIPRCTEIDEGYVFDLGGVQLKTYIFGGHTKGGIALYDKTAKNLYSGDAISPFVWLFLNESDSLPHYVASLKKAGNIDFNHLYMAHASLPAEKKALGYYMDAAENLDYAAGYNFEPPGEIKGEVRLCVRSGYGQNDIRKKGFAAIAISEDKLK